MLPPRRLSTASCLKAQDISIIYRLEFCKVCHRIESRPNVSCWRIFFGLLFALMLCGLHLTVAGAQDAASEQPAPTTWTSNKGVAVEAEFVRMTDDAVVLKMKRDGKEATVPLTSLSIDSIFQAVRLANPESFAKPVPKAEVKPQVTLELPEFNLTVEDLLKNPFTSATSIEQFLQTLERLPKEGNFISGWHALPPKMQTDLEDLIVKGHQVIGPATVKQVQILLNDLNTILNEKQQYILGVPAIAANPLFTEGLEKNLPLVGKLFESLAQEQHWQPSNFQKGSVTRWMAQLNVDLAPVILASMEAVTSQLPPGVPNPMAATSFNIVSQTADSAEVEVVNPMLPQPTKTSYQKVGNIWINVQAMNKLRESIDAANAKLATGATQEVGMIKTTLSGIIAAVGGLARADSQEEFNQAVELLQTIGAGLGSSMNLGAANGRTPGPG